MLDRCSSAPFLYCVLRVRSFNSQVELHALTIKQLAASSSRLWACFSAVVPLSFKTSSNSNLISVCRIRTHQRVKTAARAPASGPQVGWQVATERSPPTGRVLDPSLRLKGERREVGWLCDFINILFSICCRVNEAALGKVTYHIKGQ